METKFCCEKFRFFYSGDKNRGLNIRIVKFSDEFINRAQLSIDMNYIITEGYTGDIENCEKKMVINFCPFCGCDLNKNYHKEEYIQEIIS